MTFFSTAFRERGREKEKYRCKREADWLPLVRAPTRDQMCPDWGLNLQPFGYRMMLQPAEPHCPGPIKFLKAAQLHESSGKASLTTYQKG